MGLPRASRHGDCACAAPHPNPHPIGSPCVVGRPAFESNREWIRASMNTPDAVACSPLRAPYQTPPQSFRKRFSDCMEDPQRSPASKSCLLSTSPASLIRVLYDLRSKLDTPMLNNGVMICSDPEHPKHARLRRIVRSFGRDNDDALASFLVVLMNESIADA